MAIYVCPDCSKVLQSSSKYKHKITCKERYYQNILEQLLQGKPKRLDVGIKTDITTDRFHAEVSHWKDWYNAIVRKIYCYQCKDPKSELRIYFFGEYEVEKKQNIVRTCTHMDSRINVNVHVKLYECIDTGDGIIVMDLMTNQHLMDWRVQSS